MFGGPRSETSQPIVKFTINGKGWNAPYKQNRSTAQSRMVQLESLHVCSSVFLTHKLYPSHSLRTPSSIKEVSPFTLNCYDLSKPTELGGTYIKDNANIFHSK